MGQCTENARRPTVDSLCRGTTISYCVADLRQHRWSMCNMPLVLWHCLCDTPWATPICVAGTWRRRVVWTVCRVSRVSPTTCWLWCSHSCWLVSADHRCTHLAPPTSTTTSTNARLHPTSVTNFISYNWGPDLQNILRQSYDYLSIMQKLRSTWDGSSVYKTSYKERKAFLR